MACRFHKIVMVSLCFAMFSGTAVPAHAGLLEFFFPTLKNTGEDPAKTLEAPFVKEQSEVQALPEGSVEYSTPAENLPEKQLDIEKIDIARDEDRVSLEDAHRTAKDMGTWAMKTVADSLSYTGGINKERLRNNLKIFSDTGSKQYLAFLSEHKILSTAQANAYDVHAYANDEPLLLNSGAVDARFRWLFEVPVMISYVQRGTNSYEDVEPINKKYRVRVQIGRDASAVSDLGVTVERWTGRELKPVELDPDEIENPFAN